MLKNIHLERCCVRIEDTWAKKKRLNMSDGTGFVFDCVDENFTGNFYHSCFMANQDVIIKFVASDRKNKTEKNCDDFDASVTIFKGGNCFGKSRAFIFLSKRNMVGLKNAVKLSLTAAFHPTLV